MWYGLVFIQAGFIIGKFRNKESDGPAPVQAKLHQSRRTFSSFRLVRDDMSSVDQLIRESLDSNVVLIRQIAEYIIGSGGKRLRPMLVVLAARACGYQGRTISPPQPSSNSSTRPPCCMTMWSMNLICAADRNRRTRSGVMQPACWSAIFSTPAVSR